MAERTNEKLARTKEAERQQPMTIVPSWQGVHALKMNPDVIRKMQRIHEANMALSSSTFKGGDKFSMSRRMQRGTMTDDTKDETETSDGDVGPTIDTIPQKKSTKGVTISRNDTAAPKPLIEIPST